MTPSITSIGINFGNLSARPMMTSNADQAREAILEAQVNSKGGVTSLLTPPSRSEAQAGQTMAMLEPPLDSPWGRLI